MKIFLAMPYSQFCDKKYLVLPKWKKWFESLITSLESKGHSCFLAMRREEWGKTYEDEAASTGIDYNEIVACDLVIMVPGFPYSGGVHVEAGWASAHKKPINMFLEEGKFYSPMITGLHRLTKVKYYKYKKFDEVLIENIINSIDKQK